MQIVGNKAIIPNGEEVKEILLTQDEIIAVKLGFVYYYNQETDKIVIEVPEGLDFEKAKLEYLEKQANRIKQNYQNLIFAKYSLTDQLNMSNEAVQITAFAQAEERHFTEAELIRLGEIKEAKNWIDEQRAACQTDIEFL